VEYRSSWASITSIVHYGRISAYEASNTRSFQYEDNFMNTFQFLRAQHGEDGSGSGAVRNRKLVD
jgi:hypothetical protein